MKARLAMAFVIALLAAATLPTAANAGMHDGNGKGCLKLALIKICLFNPGMQDGHG